MVDPAVFKDKIVFIGLTASGLIDVFNSRSATIDDARASSCTRAWRTASWRTGSSARRRRARESRTVLIVALVVGLLAAFLPFTAAAGAAAGDSRRLDAGSRVERVPRAARG